MERILKVVSKSDVINVTKSDGTTMPKCTLVLQELGGQYENRYAVTLLGMMAQCDFRQGECYAVALRFMVHEYNGAVYQDIVMQEFHRV